MTEIDGSNLFYEIPLCNEEGNDNDNLKSNCVSVSNPEVTLNRCGLEFFPDFVTEKESIDLLNDLYATNNHKFVWEGFESKKRVLRFSLMTNDAQDGEKQDITEDLGNIVRPNQKYDRQSLHKSNNNSNSRRVYSFSAFPAFESI